MSRGTASCGIVFPDGKQRNNTRKMCRLLFPADEVRERLVCPQPRSLPPHPHPLFQCHSWAAYPLRGLQTGVPVLQPQCGGTAKGPFALAGLTLLYQLSEIPGLPCCCQPPRSPDLVLTPQLTSWLLSIYSSPTPRLLPVFPKSSRSGAASLLQAPAQGCWPETDAARNPCFHTHTHPPKASTASPLGKGTGSALVPCSEDAFATAGAPWSRLRVCRAKSGDGTEGRPALAVADGQMFYPDTWPFSAIREARLQRAAWDALQLLPSEKGITVDAWCCSYPGNGKSCLSPS